MTSVYVFTLHTCHATYLQLTCTLFHHFISLTTAIFSEWDIIKTFFPFYENKQATYKCNSSTLNKAQNLISWDTFVFLRFRTQAFLIPHSDKKTQLRVTDAYMRSTPSTRVPRVYAHKVPRSPSIFEIYAIFGGSFFQSLFKVSYWKFT